jgi:hypothetical protein
VYEDVSSDLYKAVIVEEEVEISEYKLIKIVFEGEIIFSVNNRKDKLFLLKRI